MESMSILVEDSNRRLLVKSTARNTEIILEEISNISNVR